MRCGRKERCERPFSFSQVFILGVLFGLFHGLLFLPVALSLIGPVKFEGGGESRASEAKRASIAARAKNDATKANLGFVHDEVNAAKRKERLANKKGPFVRDLLSFLFRACAPSCIQC